VGFSKDSKPRFSTRDQNGQIDNYEDFISAMKAFIGYEGYRLDIQMHDENGILHSLFIRREELPQDNGALNTFSKTYLGRIDYNRIKLFNENEEFYS
jgi:hypothetical protein